MRTTFLADHTCVLRIVKLLLVSATMVLVVPSAGRGDHEPANFNIWFTAAGVDPVEWCDDGDLGSFQPGNWIEHPGGSVYELPDSDAGTYVTTSAASATNGGPVEIEAQCMSPEPNKANAMYVGGWGPAFDAAHEASPGAAAKWEYGELDVNGVDDDTVVLDVNNHAVSGYFYVGYRGATGLLRQAGGKITALKAGFSIGQGHPDSFGLYLMEGGKHDTKTISVGYDGVGILNVRNGSYSKSQGTTGHIGRGQLLTDGMNPGIGYVGVGPGTLDWASATVKMSLNHGSVSVFNIRDGSSVTLGQLRVAVGGQASVLQTGGVVDAGWKIIIGENRGSYGSYTIRGGDLTLPTNGTDRGIFVGRNGQGRFAVIGDWRADSALDPAIEVAQNFDVNGFSGLDFELNTQNETIEPITVDKVASFDTGASIEIRYGSGFDPGANPGPHVLLTAAQGITCESGTTEADCLLDVSLFDPDACWDLSFPSGAGSEERVEVTYICP